MRFLSRLPLSIRLGKKAVVAHANYGSAKDRHQLEQICCFGAKAKSAYSGVVIHGHDSVLRPKVSYKEPTWRVNVDTSAWKGNFLTGYIVGKNPNLESSFVKVPTNELDKA